jgi:hypothetical protein
LPDRFIMVPTVPSHHNALCPNYSVLPNSDAAATGEGAALPCIGEGFGNPKIPTSGHFSPGLISLVLPN